MWQETYQDFSDASLLGTEGQLLLGELPRAPFVAQQQPCCTRGEEESGFTAESDAFVSLWPWVLGDVAVTQQSELSLEQGTSLINTKRFNKQESAATPNCTQILSHWLLGMLFWPSRFCPRSGDSSSQIMLCILCGHLLARQQTFEPHQR